MVEHNLAKVGVAGSSPVSRSESRSLSVGVPERSQLEQSELEQCELEQCELEQCELEQCSTRRGVEQSGSSPGS